MARVGKTKPHIKIGSYYFNLDESIDAGTNVGSLYRPHYAWSIQSYFSPATVQAGASENERALRTWFFDDFSGGEGNRNWAQDDPTVYDFSYGLNPRVRGQLTGAPSRARETITATLSTASDFMYFGIGAGSLWAVGGTNVSLLDQSDPSGTFSAYAGSTAITTTSTYTAVGSDPNRLLLGELLTGNATFKIRAMNAADQKTVTNGALSGMVCELATMHGFLYSLEYDLSSAILLKRYDVSRGYDYNSSTNPIGRISVSNSIPVDSSTALFSNFKSFTDTQSWYTGIAPTNNSVFFFVSTNGVSRLWEYRQRDATYPVWTAPDGFTIRDIEFSNGYVFIVGYWGPNTDNSGYGSLYVHQKGSVDTLFVADIGRSRGIYAKLSAIAASHSADVFFADGVKGRLWVYNAEEDAVSMLDSFATSGGDAAISGSIGGAGTNPTSSFTFDTTETNYVTDLITWGGLRFVAINDTGAQTFQILRYQDDEPSNRGTGTATTLTSGVNNFNLPFQQKYLTGFDVMWKIDPNSTWTTGQSIIVEYDIDGQGFVTAGTIDSTSADKNKGRTFIALATPPTFSLVRVRVTLSGTSGVKPPILVGLAGEAQSYQEVLELMVMLKNPMGNTRRGPNATSASAWAARNFLRTIAKSGAAVTVVDGYMDPRPGQTTTYTMTVDTVEDIVVRDGEGTMRVTLRTV